MLDSSCRDFNTPKRWLSPSVFLISNQSKVALLRLQSLALDTEVCQSWTTRLPGFAGFWVKGSKNRWDCVFLMFLESIVTWHDLRERSHCEVMFLSKKLAPPSRKLMGFPFWRVYWGCGDIGESKRKDLGMTFRDGFTLGKSSMTFRWLSPVPVLFYIIFGDIIFFESETL